MCLFFSCSDKRALEDYEKIKRIGDEDPSYALAMLDSLEIEIREQSDYVRHKYDLLRIRLNDKAFNTAKSDLMIKKLLNYFEENGSLPEKQEVTYYAGSVYRDLQDAPRSMEYFLKSLEYAQKNGRDCDSLMMRNAYSNLNDLYYNVQNYDNAVKMAQGELEVSKRMHKDVALPYLHLGTAYLALGKQQEAEKAFDAVLDEIIRSKDTSKHQYELLYLLNDYSCMELLPKSFPIFRVWHLPSIMICVAKLIRLSFTVIWCWKKGQTSIINMMRQGFCIGFITGVVTCKTQTDMLRFIWP